MVIEKSPAMSKYDPKHAWMNTNAIAGP